MAGRPSTTSSPAPRQAKKRSAPPRVPTAGELPVTRAMMGEMRTELIERIEQSKCELRAEIQQVKGELRAEIQQVKGELIQVKATLHGLEAGIHAVQADVARIALLVEEQNARRGLTGSGEARISSIR